MESKETYGILLPFMQPKPLPLPWLAGADRTLYVRAELHPQCVSKGARKSHHLLILNYLLIATYEFSPARGRLGAKSQVSACRRLDVLAVVRRLHAPTIGVRKVHGRCMEGGGRSWKVVEDAG